MKNYYMITKEATKYWKKAIKNDRVMVTQHDGTIYIVNGYNAFKFPATPAIWDEIARPAFMQDMPEEGKAFQYLRGEKQPATSVDIVRLIDRNLEDTTPAARSPFAFDSKNISVRLYKNSYGSITGINSAYDAMVDPSQVSNMYCAGKLSPVILSNDHFTALLMPVRLDYTLTEAARETFSTLLEG